MSDSKKTERNLSKTSDSTKKSLDKPRSKAEELDRKLKPHMTHDGTSIKLPVYNPDFSPAPNVPVDRRYHKDAIVLLAEACVALSWILMGGVVAALAFAQPKMRTWLSPDVSEYWNMQGFQIMFYVLISNLAVCFLGTLFRTFRRRRADDKFSRSLFITAAISVIGIAVLLLSGVMWE